MLKRYRFLIVLSLCVLSYLEGTTQSKVQVIDKPVYVVKYVKVYQPLKHQPKHDQVSLLASAIPASLLKPKQH